MGKEFVYKLVRLFGEMIRIFSPLVLEGVYMTLYSCESS